MKVEKINGSEIKFEVVVEGIELSEIRKLVLKKFKNVKVDGFRKGHVPQDVIEKTFEADIRDEVVNEILKKEYVNYIVENKIKPLTDLEMLKFEYNKDKVELTFKVSVFPDFEIGEYKNLSVELKNVEVTDEDVEKEINKSLQNAKTYVKADRDVAENNDIAIIDFEGFVDGVTFEGGKAENHRLELGSKTFIDTFEEQIVGKKVGDEFDVVVTFPEEYHAENLKGKNAIFKVKLNSLEISKLPELNDEFAKTLGMDTLEDLRSSVKGNLLSNREVEAKREKLSKIVELIANKVECDIPSRLVDMEVDNNLEMFNQQLQMQGINLDAYLKMINKSLDDMRKDLEETAKKGIKNTFVLQKIAEIENITVTKDEIEKELNRIAAMYGMTYDDLVKELEKSNGVERFYSKVSNELFFGKINDYLLENN